ncbi:hypothetical protein PR202_gb24603 [Eleusine coracana subsp. coracana]|uniref:Pentatricopeptide repeat-containing protein n=1 Tax=Eleusine coracana subsp. coracana TaxID=191504 RepID=A0AAV5FM34_ELECO|nr:hypothetical protein PR202_gb24603 [Eleusine coracana subsp. coracana]
MSKFSSHHLAAALRREPGPVAALRPFITPPTDAAPGTPFRYSIRCYDIIISMLAVARLFPAMESILSCLLKAASHIRPREQLLCCVISSYGHPNAYMYTSLMKGLCEKGDVDAAVRLKEKITGDADIVLDSAIYATLVRALFRVGRKCFYEDGRDPCAVFALLEDMKKSGCKVDVVSYNTLLVGLCKLGRWQDASELLEDMPMRGCSPDVVTYRIFFDAMCSDGAFQEADQVLDEMVFKGFAPSKDGARIFVQGIVRKANASSLESMLCRLVNVNALESSGWRELLYLC